MQCKDNLWAYHLFSSLKYIQIYLKFCIFWNGGSTNQFVERQRGTITSHLGILFYYPTLPFPLPHSLKDFFNNISNVKKWQIISKQYLTYFTLIQTRKIDIFKTKQPPKKCDSRVPSAAKLAIHPCCICVRCVRKEAERKDEGWML